MLKYVNNAVRDESPLFSVAEGLKKNYKKVLNAAHRILRLFF